MVLFCAFIFSRAGVGLQVWSVTCDWRLGLKDGDSESKGVLDFEAVYLPSPVLDCFLLLFFPYLYFLY